MRRRLDLTGKRFGALEVLGPAGISEKGATLWRCKCHLCGSETVIVGHKLTMKSHPATNCGCVARKKLADLSGETHGALEVIRRTGSGKNGDRVYLCRCMICGKEKEFPANAIRINPKSCGCRQYTTERMAKMSPLGVAAMVEDGCNIYTATRREPNADNTTGYRCVRCLHRKSGDFIYAAFFIKGKRYYRGGFSSLISAHEWAEKEHDRLLNALGISDPRENRKKERST